MTCLLCGGLGGRPLPRMGIDFAMDVVAAAVAKTGVRNDGACQAAAAPESGREAADGRVLLHCRVLGVPLLQRCTGSRSVIPFLLPLLCAGSTFLGDLLAHAENGAAPPYRLLIWHGWRWQTRGGVHARANILKEPSHCCLPPSNISL